MPVICCVMYSCICLLEVVVVGLMVQLKHKSWKRTDENNEKKEEEESRRKKNDEEHNENRKN